MNEFFQLTEMTQDFLQRTSAKAVARPASKALPPPTSTPSSDDHQAEDEVVE